MTKSATSSTLFLLLFNLLLQSARCEINRISDEFGAKTSGPAQDGSSKEADDTMIRRIEEEMLLLNKSGEPIRDKRALGILLQGFMEALGYTVSPIQLASLPNPAPMPGGGAAANMSAMSAQQSQAMPPAMMMNASASTPQRQRETLRFTGLLNFGNSQNTSNLINHLAQYEQMFHGNRSATPAAMMPAAAPMPAAAAPAVGPDIDPRSRPPLKEPLFVKIPLPIVPNLPPPQPPSPMPIDHSYHEQAFDKESSEEYSSSKDEEAQKGHFSEEDEDSHDSEDFDYKHDKYDTPEERNYENKETVDSYEQPKSQVKHVENGYTETYVKPKEKHVEYKNNKNVEKFTVENKEINDAKEVDTDGPPGGSRFNHQTYIDEQDEKIYKLAAEQEARAEALAEENAERDQEKYRNDEREKQIDEANEERDVSYQKKAYYADEGSDDASTEKEYDDDGPYHKHYEDDEEEAYDHKEDGTHRSEARMQLPSGVAQQAKSYTDPGFYPATLPISYERDDTKSDKTLRDSYGASLEKPGGKVDERVAEYITMFKNPQTGVYDPKRIHEYEHARISFDHSDLIDGFNRIQKEYGNLPENKYEEYEIDGDQLEHRSNNKHEKQMKEKPVTSKPKHDCNCDKNKKAEAELQVARSSERPITHPPPSRSSAQPEISYGPYYSSVKSLYEPLENDHGIIARLTSYDTPTTVKFEDSIELVHNDRTTLTPTMPPEKLTTYSFPHEAESKEFRAWPAPYDYPYDDSDHRNIVHQKPPPTASSPAPFKPTRPSCNHHMIPFGEHKDRVKMIFRDGSAERQRNDRGSSRPNRKTKPTEKIHKRVEYFPTTQATIFDQRKKPPRSERLTNHRASTKPATRPPSISDIITSTRPTRPHSTTKHPRKNRKATKHYDHSIRPTAAKIRQSTIKPTIKVKYTYPHGQNHGNSREETTHYIEKGGTLIVSEPTPYNYNEGYDEYTEEPQTHTERVQIKEYRNHVASVEVAELKQLHPEGPMHIFKYTRNY